MADILKIVVGDLDLRVPSTSVDAYVQKVVADDGSTYLYLYNFAAGGPKPGDSPTQTLRFDYTAAKAFKAIVDETFGVL
jgi:hypothetical protein